MKGIGQLHTVLSITLLQQTVLIAFSVITFMLSLL